MDKRSVFRGFERTEKYEFAVIDSLATIVEYDCFLIDTMNPDATIVHAHLIMTRCTHYQKSDKCMAIAIIPERNF